MTNQHDDTHDLSASLEEQKPADNAETEIEEEDELTAQTIREVADELGLSESDLQDLAARPSVITLGESWSAQMYLSPQPKRNADEVLPREEVKPLKPFCTYPQGSECNRCVLACPKEAITVDEQGPSIDQERCSKCGICIGICDAFSSVRITTLDLFAKAKRIMQTGDPLFITCNECLFPGFEPHSNVIVVPCLAQLSPEFWAALLASGNPLLLYCDDSYCDSCEAAGSIGKELYTQALTMAQDWTGYTAKKVNDVPEKDSLINRYAALGAEDNYDRRGIFSSFAHEVTDIASGKYRKRNSSSLGEFHERRERMRALGEIKQAEQAETLPIGNQAKSKLRPKQQLLLEAITQNPSRAARIPRFISTTLHEVCKGHKTCIDTCPTGARFWDSAHNRVAVDAKRCITCGICVRLCPEGACDFKQTTAQELIDN